MQNEHVLFLSWIDWGIVSGAFLVLVALTSYLFKRSMRDIDNRFREGERRMDSHDESIKNIESNHTAKFDEVKACVFESSKEIIELVNKMRVDIAENYVTKKDCRFVQEHYESKDS